MTRGRLLLIAIAVTGVVGLLGMQLAAADTTPFAAPGTGLDFVVPEGVCQVTVSALGASGGDGSDPIITGPSAGGGGDHATGTINVTPGEHLGVNVGGRGGDGSLGIAFAAGGTSGINGGGEGGLAFFPAFVLVASGGGGGGASDVRQGSGGSGCVPCAAPVLPTGDNTAPESRVVTAGGGGGGGAGIFVSGGEGGAGGATSAGTPTGDGETDPVFGSPPGGEGGQAGADGGSGGTGSIPTVNDGDPGTTTGQGGDGGGDPIRGGGGGGGGDTGGGGGGGGAAGGGGGSSAVTPTATNVTVDPGVNTDADGSVTLDYSAQAQPACVLGVSATRSIHFTG
jgi:hypothetical protein